MKQMISNYKSNRETVIKVLFYTIAFVVIYLLVFSISPLSDDWYYLTAPNPDFTPADLLPDNQFWRPFDAIFGGLMGLMPQLFPALNRAVVVLGHILSVALVGEITKRIGIKTKWQIFSVCFFLLSSSVWAVTVSPDALNQVFSVLFGLVAIWFHFKHGGYCYLIFCMLALLWKESGVSWFFVVPIFDVLLNKSKIMEFFKSHEAVKRTVKQVVASLLSVVVYFVVRFYLQGEISLGSSDGTYKLSLLSFSTIKNGILLFASGSTGVDSIALFGKERSWLLVAITVLLSGVFLLSFMLCAFNLVFKKKMGFPVLCIIVCIAGLALPLMILGSAGEMHAYPVLCGMSILFSFCFSKSDVSFKRLLIPVLCVFVAFGISSGHKLATIYDYSNRTEQLSNSIMENYDDSECKTLFVVIDNWDGYSVFTQSAIMGTYKGYSVRQYFDWADVENEQYDAESVSDADDYIKAHSDEYDKVFIVEDETAISIK